MKKQSPRQLACAYFLPSSKRFRFGLMKRDLLFVVERLASMLDERHLAIVLRHHGIGKAKDPTDTPAKLLAAFSAKRRKAFSGVSWWRL